MKIWSQTLEPIVIKISQVQGEIMLWISYWGFDEWFVLFWDKLIEIH